MGLPQAAGADLNLPLVLARGYVGGVWRWLTRLLPLILEQSHTTKCRGQAQVQRIASEIPEQAISSDGGALHLGWRLPKGLSLGRGDVRTLQRDMGSLLRMALEAVQVQLGQRGRRLEPQRTGPQVQEAEAARVAPSRNDQPQLRGVNQKPMPSNIAWCRPLRLASRVDTLTQKRPAH